MFLVNWFHQKKAGSAAPAPVKSSARAQAGVESHSVSKAEGRKAERHERRELLYGVVRESMVHAGALSASYKFKVLSLDSSGRQYMVMMDLAHEFDGAVGRLAEIEAAIIKGAKTRYEILVTAVYWRVSNRGAEQSGEKKASQQKPLRADEVAAFKQAFAADSPAAVSGNKAASGPRSPGHFTGFEDTKLTDFDELRPPLSPSQYNDLK